MGPGADRMTCLRFHLCRLLNKENNIFPPRHEFDIFEKDNEGSIVLLCVRQHLSSICSLEYVFHNSLFSAKKVSDPASFWKKLKKKQKWAAYPLILENPRI